MEQDFLEILKVCNIVAFMFIKSVFLLLILQKLIKLTALNFQTIWVSLFLKLERTIKIFM